MIQFFFGARILLILATGLTLFSGSCFGFTLSDALGVVRDPLKLGKASVNILSSVEHLQSLMKDVGQLEATTNKDIADRLSQVKQITDGVIDSLDRNVANVQQIVHDAEIQVAALERDIFARAERLIESARCAVVNVARVQFESALRDAARSLKAANPRVRLLGFTIIDLTTNEIQISDPWTAYTSVREEHLGILGRLTEDSPASEFIHHYGEIERLSRDAQCSYQGTPASVWLELDRLKYDELATRWVTVVHPI